MKIISSCTILFILILNVLCTGKQNKGWNITFNPPQVTAVPGLCALISCTFTYPENAAPIKNVLWNACNNKGICKTEIFRLKNVARHNNSAKDGIESVRIKMLETDLAKNNCSIIMNDIQPEDEKEYKLTIKGPGQNFYDLTVRITIQDEPIMDVPLLNEGQEANLTCSAPFPCPETPPEITWWIKTRQENIIDLKENTTQTTSKSLYHSNLTLTLTSDLHHATLRCDVSYGSKNISTKRTLEVMYVKPLLILGNDNVTEGDTLNLSCTVESHPLSSLPVWSFSGTTDRLVNQTSAEYLTITNVTKEHAGVYSCMRTYGNKTLNASITISVTGHINEEKVNESLSSGSENMQVNDGNTTVIDDFLKNLDISKIITFVAGMACSALIFLMVLCCWVSCRRRKKHKVPTANPDTVQVNLETVQTDVAQTGTNEQTPLHGQLNGGNPNPAAPTDGAEEDEVVKMEAGEVDYASIDYSLLKDRPPEEAERESTDTDYAEIKRDRKGEGNKREVLQDGNDEIENPNQMEGEEEIYSNSQELS